MSKLFWNALKLSPMILSAALLLANRTLAEPSIPSDKLQQIDRYNQVPSTNEPNSKLGQVNQYISAPTVPAAQVTSVSQLSDVQPTDWAFQALQSLVERYGCIVGYPDGTYRGNRALTRYEFAAGLNACLDRVNELITTATADLVRREDLATLQRLQSEFAAELTTLRGRVDTVEARTAELEANQFSTTTKLAGEAIFAVSGVGGDTRSVPSGRAQGSAGNIKDNEVFQDRVRIALNTSFSGRDLLRTRLQSRNLTPLGSNVTGTNMTRLSFEGDEGNSTYVDQLFYRFPIAKNSFIQIDAANLELGERGFPTFSPFESSATGSISRYGRFSPIYRAGNNSLASGTGILNSGQGAGVSIHVNPQGTVGFDLAYLAPTANQPGTGFGIANGSYAAVAQIDFNASKYFNLGLTYSHAYDNPQRRNNAINIFDNTGSLLAEAPFGTIPTTTNNYGLELSFRPSQQLIVFGWGGYTQAIAQTAPRLNTLGLNGATRVSGSRGSKADIFYYAGGLAFPDLGKQGNLLGFLFGQSPKVYNNDVLETVNGRVRRRRDSDTSYHAEAFFRYRVTDNIDITPGVLIVFNPEHNNNNPTDYVGTVRTTFRF